MLGCLVFATCSFVFAADMNVKSTPTVVAASETSLTTTELDAQRDAMIKLMEAQIAELRAMKDEDLTQLRALVDEQLMETRSLVDEKRKENWALIATHRTDMVAKRKSIITDVNLTKTERKAKLEELKKENKAFRE